MSTTFDVYPSTEKMPSFADVLEKTTAEFSRFLREMKITEKKPILTFCLGRKKTDPYQISDLTRPFQWKESEYLWGGIKGITGGTDGYFMKLDDEDKEMFLDDVLPKAQKLSLEHHVLKCLESEFYWYFRRSAGQPASINILYGLLAGSVATLTKGLIFSDDSAWDYEVLPMTGAELLESFMYPHKCNDPNFRSWAERCIEGAKQDFITEII